MPTDLQTLLTAIPTAEDGHIITREYHNTLRAAVVGLAQQMGVSVQQEKYLTLSPYFFPADPAPRWSQGQGKAYLSLEVVNLEEIQAKVRGELEGAVAAAVATATRGRELMQIVSNIPPNPISVQPTLLNTAENVVAAATTAQTAVRAAVDAITTSAAEQKINEALVRGQEMLATANAAFGLATHAQALAGAIPGALSFLGQCVQALARASIARASAAEALEKIQAAAATLATVTQSQGSVKPTSCTGWLPFQLSDDARIQKVIVTGLQRGALIKFQVRLVRQKIQDSSETTLVTLDLQKAGEPFQVTGQADGAGLKLEDRIINNALYKYLIVAQVDAVLGARAQLDALQIVYTP